MPQPYVVGTVGEGWCEVDDRTECADKKTAWEDAGRRIARYPEYCTAVYARDGKYLDVLWTSRPDPDDDPTIPLPPGYGDREGLEP